MKQKPLYLKVSGGRRYCVQATLFNPTRLGIHVIGMAKKAEHKAAMLARLLPKVNGPHNNK